MKKAAVLILLLLFSLSASAEQNLSFLYINGSNNNDTKMKNWYENGVKKLHPVLRKKFLENKELKYYFVDGEYNIKEEPVIFFWGYNSKDDLSFVKKQLEISKNVSSLGAYLARNLITEFLHDAIWVQKQHNMLGVLEDLNLYVKNEAKKGNSVVLYGYSAGTFVSYEYMFNKLRYINAIKLLEEIKADDDIIRFAKANPQNNTCISALTADYYGFGTMSQSGHFIINSHKEQLKSSYLNLDELTEEYCAPLGKFKGIVNFASPLPLFYSDISDEKFDLSYYNKLLIKYILENNIFMLTVNFKEDPLGFPTNRNLTVDEIAAITGIFVENPNGIIFDNSGVWSKRMFALAHTAYWNAKNTFSSAVVNSLVKAYKFQYDEEYRKKIMKKNGKKDEL